MEARQAGIRSQRGKGEVPIVVRVQTAAAAPSGRRGDGGHSRGTSATLHGVVFDIFADFQVVMPLVQQTGNHRALKQDQRADYDDLPAISVPSGWLAKIDRTAGRKEALADAPAFQLSPI